jgi:hypothetical protein
MHCAPTHSSYPWNASYRPCVPGVRLPLHLPGPSRRMATRTAAAVTDLLLKHTVPHLAPGPRHIPNSLLQPIYTSPKTSTVALRHPPPHHALMTLTPAPPPPAPSASCTASHALYRMYELCPHPRHPHTLHPLAADRQRGQSAPCSPSAPLTRQTALSSTGW